jgi:glycine cleavage system H lipoate-binding protein
MSVIFLLLFIAIAIGVGAWVQRKRAKIPQEEVFKAKISSLWEGIFVHPGHTWVEVVEPNLVAVGADEFTKSVFGSIERLILPESGTMIQQGGNVWRLKRGTRQLVQASPISGRVVEVNQDVMQNPQLLAQKDTKQNWVLKVRPTKLKRELQNLLHGNMLSRWNQAVKDQLVAVLVPSSYPVLQEGGEIKPDLGNELTSEQWEKVTAEFFKPGQRKDK